MKKIKTPKNNTITNVMCSITITIESHKIKVCSCSIAYNVLVVFYDEARPMHQRIRRYPGLLSM